MKKIFLIWAVLVLAAPAMALTDVVITATPDGTTGNVDIIVTWSGGGSPPRAFAIDVNVTSDVNIIDVSGYHTGESETGNKGFGIFPASFNREIDADDPNWADVNYTPVADACDLPGDTLAGLVPGSSGVTLELGSLYTGPNVPTSPSTLATITVDGSCTLCMKANVGRGKIVLEDGNEPDSTTANCVSVTVVVVCTVPNVVDMLEATAITAITNAGFVAGTPTTAYDDGIAADNVISTTPGAGVATCSSTVEIVTSLGPCVVPNVVTMTQANATTALTDAGFAVTNDSAYDDSVAVGIVISQDQAPASEPGCGTTVNITVSLGPCTLISVVGFDEATAEATIIALNFTVGNKTSAYDNVVPATIVISQGLAPGVQPCGDPVDLHISLGPCVVPNVVGMDQATAEAAIIAAGFNVGTVAIVAGAPLGDVMAQSPAPAGTPGCGTDVDIDVAGDCLKTTHLGGTPGGYNRWLGGTNMGAEAPPLPPAPWSKPDCWCYPRQCRGDVTGTPIAPSVPMWVSGADLIAFRLAVNRMYTLGGWPVGGICSDFDHATIAPGVPMPVSGADLIIFRQYVNQMNIPCCDTAPTAGDCVLTAGDDFNFWTGSTTP